MTNFVCVIELARLGSMAGRVTLTQFQGVYGEAESFDENAEEDGSCCSVNL